MKNIFTTLFMAAFLSMSAMAVTVNQAAGTFRGNLNIGGDLYPNKEVYVLPGVKDNTITFVLPNFTYGQGNLGNIVLPNIPMDVNGQLRLENASLYLKAISERAVITVINGLEDGGVTYNSILSGSEAMVLLSIAAPSLPEPILVLFTGAKVTGDNYAITNGGFEGSWSNNEVSGWHSFKTATGDYSSFVTGSTEQFKQSTDKRPGSTGSHSVFLSSKMTLGAKANGNCTNGQINAGSMTADDASGNYNFSDPSNTGYNTPFVGQPDSMVFWAKYIPADKNPSNSVNKARMNTVITTNARYQDPESNSYANVKIASATINYAATSDMSWQRLSVPFQYTSLDPSQAAYVLVTFSTNQTPGGGSSYSSGSLFNKKYYYDNVYIDDAEIIYNHSLTSLKMNETVINFTNGQAQTGEKFSDETFDFVATSNGKAAQTFIGFDASTSRVHVYVVPDNYSQKQDYSLYTLQMAPADTYFAYSATTCDNEPYSDNLFSNLTEAGEYVKTIKNVQGGDSIVTLTLAILPTYEITENLTITVGDHKTWEGNDLSTYATGKTTLKAKYTTVNGCDSVRVLNLTVEAAPDTHYEYSATTCDNEPYSDNLFSNLTEAGEYVTTIKNVKGSDSIITLTLSILPTYEITENLTITVGDHKTWEGNDLSTYATGKTTLKAKYTTVNGCDSVRVLNLTVEAAPDTHYEYSATTCDNEPYSDNLFSNLTEAGEYVTTIKNVKGSDSIITLTLSILPTYEITEQLTITVGDHKTWEGNDLSTYATGKTTLKAKYTTVNGCDSVRVLNLTVEAAPDTHYEYSATTCDNEPYSDNLFSNLTEAGEYVTTIKNVKGSDSIITLTLSILPTYEFTEELTITEGEQQTWEGIDLSTLAPCDTTLRAKYVSVSGCDSVRVLNLTVEQKFVAPNTYYAYSATTCDNEPYTDELFTNLTEAGEYVTTIPNVQGSDSIITLTLAILPTYEFTEELTITEGDQQTWEGIDLSTIAPGDTTLRAEYVTVSGCDSVLVLNLTVEPQQNITTALPSTDNRRYEQKIINNGHLYIIRDDETMYDELGRKVK